MCQCLSFSLFSDLCCLGTLGPATSGRLGPAPVLEAHLCFFKTWEHPDCNAVYMLYNLPCKVCSSVVLSIFMEL